MVDRKHKPERPDAAKLRLLSGEFEAVLRKCGADTILKQMSPREFVDLMTSSSFEIGRIFKGGLRDALYDLRGDAERKRSRSRRGTDI
jgi:hypothetical protein